MSSKSVALGLANGPEEVVARLEELKGQFERGEIRCAALRVYNADGTWQDVVLGGDTDDERANALADLHRAFESRH